MKILLIALALLAVAGFLFFNSRKKKSTTTSKEITHGPFVVRTEATTGKTYNMNYGMVNYTNLRYAVFYNGKPVPFPSALQNNTGLPFLWKVYALPGAPDPTLLAGSQSLYLIYLKNGELVVEPLFQQGSDFASYQFLDSEDGQPGVHQEVFMSSDVADLGKLDSLQGGRFLLVSGHAVLDVQTRKFWLFNVNNNDVDNYSFPSPSGALAFSPDRKGIVFHAEFQSWNTQTADLPDSEHALVVYNFEVDKGYVVKYDDTDTRMTDVTKIDRAWLNTYFEWKKDRTGGDILQLRRLEKLPDWTGKYDEKENYYTLYPVKPGMLPVFLDFALRQLGWTRANIQKDETHEYTGHCLELASGKVKLDIRFKEDERILTFSKNLYEDMTPEYQTLVRKIADAFNSELSDGKHQEHFGRILNETKQIRGGE